MGGRGEDRIAGLVSRGWALLQEGQARDAIHVFGRVLLRDPAHEEARRGLRESRLAVREADRALDARLEEAAQALEAGDLLLARRLIEGVVDRVGDADRALNLLDRTDTREGRLADGPGFAGAGAVAEGGESAQRSSATWRLAFAASWTVVVASLTVTVAWSWERLVSRLTDAPHPRHEAPSPAQHGFSPSRTEQVLADARRRIEAGDRAGALEVLALVPPEEPLYPLAVQLRQQVEGDLEAGGRSP